MSDIPEITKKVNSLSNVTTMSSQEIASLTGKRHDNVLRDIENMFQKLEVSLLKFEKPDFKGTYTNRGKKYPCYHLPKRECLILVSGYDVNLRAKIIDRWAELEVEKRVSFKAQKLPSATTIMRFHKHLESLAKQVGLKDNQLLLKVNRGVTKITGVDQLGVMDIKHLPSSDNDEYLTITQIGERLNPPQRARFLNKLLLKRGLQVSKVSGGYIPTPKGEEYGGKMCDVPMQHVEGSTQSLKWNSSLLVPYLQNEFNNNQHL
ncbi:Rha family transcriptional regulator [Candidatus Liberibacter asiaticus]|uniref:Rha family transcriptional regulator n=1 Tax=Liberibacter asiaticus TaxID=34021 RepID=UPI001928E871|nr:Rha family transcriptional regulator [Candidatus Liberibacter asiaticus]